MKEIDVLCHACIKLINGIIIYIDPFRVKEDYFDADYIFITHIHYDHFSDEDIKKVMKNVTKFVLTKDLKEKIKVLGISDDKIYYIEPNQNYNIDKISFETIPAYNISKQFHPKQNAWVGYVINLEGTRYYIAGDTDFQDDNKKVECDVAFLPVGGTYTMTAEEAAKLANIIKPKLAIPIHYGEVVGTAEDAKKFASLLNEQISCEILI